MNGPMHGLRVVEYADERGSYAGKLLADMSAEVIKVEPPEGDPTRRFEPFLDDEPHPERSLYFWQYNANKQSVVLDLEGSDAARDAFRRLAATADFLIESMPPGRMADLGLDYPDLQPGNEALIYISITPFGRDMPRANEHATDLTIFSNGGVTWMNGYDDHALPPVRGGNQAYHTGAHYAVLSGLVALLHRDQTGRGQYIDVNMNAAANVTTEAGSYTWLVSKETVQRQTGRHAAVRPSIPTQVQCADGKWANTGLPPRKSAEFARTHQWLEDSGLLDEFLEAPLLLEGAARERIDLSKLAEDEELQAIFGAGRNAMSFIASKLTAYEFFTGAQERGFQVGIIYSPEEVLSDPHFQARQWPVEVEHPELGRRFTYPGAPYRFEKSPWSIRRRPPMLGEDTETVLASLGYSPDEVASLSSTDVPG